MIHKSTSLKYEPSSEQVGAGMTDVEAADIVRAELFAKPSKSIPAQIRLLILEIRNDEG